MSLAYVKIKGEREEGKDVRKSVRARRDVEHQRKREVLAQQDQFTHKLTETVAVCIEHAWV